MSEKTWIMRFDIHFTFFLKKITIVLKSMTENLQSEYFYKKCKFEKQCKDHDGGQILCHRHGLDLF